MKHEFQVSVYFAKEWGDKRQVKREMALRKGMRQRLARQFKQFRSKQDAYDVTFFDAPEDLGERISAFLKGKVGEADVRGRDVIGEAEWRRARYLQLLVPGEDADTYFDRKGNRVRLNDLAVLCKTCGRADHRGVPSPYRVLDRIDRQPQPVFRTTRPGIHVVSSELLDRLDPAIGDQIESGHAQLVTTTEKPVKAKRRWRWVRPKYAIGVDPAVRRTDPCPACGGPRNIEWRLERPIFSERDRVTAYGRRDLDWAVVPTWVNAKDPRDVIPSHTVISGRLFDLLKKCGVKSLVRPKAPVHSMRKNEPAYWDAERPFATGSAPVETLRRKPIAPKPAVMSADDVRAFLRAPGTFSCAADGRGTVELRVAHRTRPPATEKDIATAEKALGRGLTPSHRRLLAITDGGALFADAKQKSDTGLVLYSAKQLARENRRMKESSRDAAEALADKLLVGEPVGYGNWIAVDYAKTSKLGEPPIVYVDHEGGGKDGAVVAASFEDLLRKLADDPLNVFRRALDDAVLYTDGRREMLEPKAFAKRG